MPALMQMLCEYHSGDRMSYPTLRLALLSGDWIPLTLPEQMRERLNETMDIISLGGATECAIWSVYYPIGEVESTWTSIPYGRGLRNQPVYVLNAQLEECPVGVEGEICIGGMGLAQGYLNDAEKTAASFVWREASGERIYRTGDRGRYFADGQVAFLGRNDTQVKVNGYRIELGKSSAALRDIPMWSSQWWWQWVILNIVGWSLLPNCTIATGRRHCKLRKRRRRHWRRVLL